MPDFVTQIKDHFDLKVQEMKDSLSVQLDPLKEQLSSHENSIENINKAIRRLEEDKGNGPRSQITTLKEERYWASRKSGRFWAIAGNTEEELKTSVRNFIIGTLLVPPDEVSEDRITSVRRTRTAHPLK